MDRGICGEPPIVDRRLLNWGAMAALLLQIKNPPASDGR
jgi:hypothetical protein